MSRRNGFPGLVNPAIAVPKIQVVKVGISTNSGPWASYGATWSHSVISGDNRLLVAVVRTVYGEPVPTSLTFNGDALTEYYYAIYDQGDKFRVAFWYLIAPDVGTYDFVITFSVNTTWTCGVVDFKNVRQTNPLDGESFVAGNDDSPYITCEASLGDLVLGNFCFFSNNYTRGTNLPAVQLWDFFSEWDKVTVGAYLVPTQEGDNTIYWSIDAYWLYYLTAGVTIKSISN